MLDNLKNIANIIYLQIEDINKKLMHKSEDCNNDGKETFEDVMNFYITSHAMSFLKNLCLGLEKSLGTILNMRCILEGKAFLECHSKNGFTEEQLELFKVQFAIIEHKQYKDFIDMENVIFPEDLEKNYNSAVEKFKNSCPNGIKLNKVLKTGFPCLLKEKFKFEHIVKEYSTEDELCMYKTCSQFIHPNDCNTLFNLDITMHYVYILNYILERYIDNKTLNCKISFTDFHNILTNEKDSISYKIKGITLQQVELLSKCASVFTQFYGNNYNSNVLNILIKLLQDITEDSLFGLSEQVKVKWKIILEIVATMDALFDFHKSYEEVQNCYKLLVMHTKKQLNTNNNIQNVDLNEAYKCYKTLYPNGLDFENFEKEFNSTLGFLVNDKGLKNKNNNNEKITLTVLVKTLLSKFTNESTEPNKDICKIMNLNYIESQMLSHSNGYMYYSNSGAWCDSDSVILSFDYCMCYILQKFLNVYNVHSIIDETKRYKTIRNCLRNSIERYKCLVEEKSNLMKSMGKIDRTKL